MDDSGSTPAEDGTREPSADESIDGADPSAEDRPSDAERPVNGRAREELAERVEEEYDFENFTPEDMAEMSPEEWEAAFDPDSWITGPALLDRVERDLNHRVAERQVFAVVERITDGDDERLVAYSDSGYAIVFPDGSVEGRGTVVRDVKPSVALCSMDDYDVPDAPDDAGLPDPVEVPEGSGELGNLMLQVVAGVQVLAGFVLVGGSLTLDIGSAAIVGGVIGLVFVAIGAFLFLIVANARLSDRFRSEEYRNRLRAAGVASGERPDFLPIDDDAEESNE